ncbi:unnamed protein product [Hydatigera taeniaeformis]|uniref:Secreted protein n=1 Tax=Hydatigena taeniaeformis TaxID=6205 RepID=A0A0R3WUP6_HYDTA|nr:unnamed protein product [Hydatigera taeniaeformis]
MLDLFGFCDLLVQRTVERLGLRLDSTVASDSAGIEGADRLATFGHAMSFEPMTSMLRNFASSFRGESAVFLLKLLIVTLNWCFSMKILF